MMEQMVEQAAGSEARVEQDPEPATDHPAVVPNAQGAAPVLPEPAVAEPAPARVWPLRKRLAGLLQTRAHFGGALAVLRGAANAIPALVPLADRVEERLDARAQVVARGFDARYAVETYERLHLFQVEVGKKLDPNHAGWCTCPINPDFLDEIVRRLPIAPPVYSFVDVGAGKGAAVMMADKHRFRRLLAIEFSATFIEIARRNLAQFEKIVGRRVPVEWVCQDFMTYDLPAEPSVFFLNNPFPDPISLRALAHIETSLRRHPRPAIVVWRKVSKLVTAHLDRSPVLRPLEWSPYWKAYQSVVI
jgi:hypothetical protein